MNTNELWATRAWFWFLFQSSQYHGVFAALLVTIFCHWSTYWMQRKPYWTELSELWGSISTWVCPEFCFYVNFIHLWCKSHVVEELLFLAWQGCWCPPMYAQRLVFNIHRANLCYHEWFSIFFQAKHYHDISNPICVFTYIYIYIYIRMPID